MKTSKIKVSQVKINGENPRTITSDKFQKLVNSILVFPQMLDLRPVVIDKTFTALGGNMRTQALKAISTFGIEEIQKRLSESRDYLEKTDGEKQNLIAYWTQWLTEPTVLVVDASSLSEAQKKEFIVKDNVQFGTWDYDGLANKFDNIKLNEWGMDVWNPMPFNAPTTPNIGDFAGQSQVPGYTPSAPTAPETDGAQNPFGDALPPELQGIDLTPADLPKIEGTDEVAMERIIIVYKKDQKEKLLNLIGLTNIEKVVYNLDEILPEE